LEDRLVKRFMVEACGRTASPSRHDPRGLLAREAVDFRLLTQRAIRPGDDEAHTNPRSRSARLRALRRLDAGVRA
jgi:16S rRNA (cytosine1402-N4)-methyltransferase